MTVEQAPLPTLVQGDINLLGFLTRLQLQSNVSSPAQALNANVTLGQIIAALAEQAQSQSNTGRAGALGTLAATTINFLDLLTGLIQLYNRSNVLGTPS